MSATGRRRLTARLIGGAMLLSAGLAAGAQGTGAAASAGIALVPETLPSALPAPPSPTLATRPLRAVPLPLPELPHQGAWPRATLAFPADDPQYQKFLQAYLSPGGRKWLEAVYERARPYAAYILERIRFYQVPDELFFLPFIESEYSARAVSRSGAAGLWQFMRNSIGGYDMRIDDWVDERRDFMKSTDGALRKLRWNYEHFGDWSLAIAAYNCGVGAMDRAIAKGGSRDYWALKAGGFLPTETASYLPKLFAVAGVAMRAGRNGLAVSWEPAPEWVRVELDRPVDLAMLASLSGADLETLRQGNPELRYGVTPPEGRYALKVPAGTESAVRAALASRERLMNVYLHVVKSGDTVSAIARHYEVTVAMITKLNPGMNPDRIRLGQTIAIPAFKDKKPYEGAAAEDRTVAFTGTYVVKKGDTLWTLSLAYGVQPETLAQRNGLTLDSVLREGATLVVPILE